MGEQGTYTGGCHCGRVRFGVRMQLERVLACNCSICSKTGSLLAFVPADQFTLLSGEDSLADYQFNQRKIHHLFCKNCGIRSFAHGADEQGKVMYAINVRALDDVDPTSFPVDFFDGKSL
jgi:hypothetical protein